MTTPFSSVPLAALPVNAGDYMLVNQADSQATNGQVTRRVTVGQMLSIPYAFNLVNAIFPTQLQYLVAFVGVFVAPTGTTADTANAQAAANAAAAAGLPLNLGAGTWNWTNGGIVIGTGLEMTRGGQTGNGYKGLTVRGAGMSATTINIGANKTAFLFANDSGAIGIQPQVMDLSIIGTGIGSGSTALQFGGRSTVRSDLLEYVRTERVLIDNVTNAMIFDDVTGVDGVGNQILRFKFCYQFGYNVDDVRLHAQINPDQSQVTNIACTISSGSNVISGIPAATIAQLQVGYAICAPGKFAQGGYVGTLGASSVTVVDYAGSNFNASSNGTACSFTCGRVFNFGIATACAAGTLYPERGSPFVSPYWSGGGGVPLQGRISASNHYYSGLVNGVEIVTEIPGNSHFNIQHNLYIERCNLIMRFGEAASSSQSGNVNFDFCYLGQPQFYTQVPFVVLCSSPAYAINIRNNTCDGSAISTVWFQDATYAYGRRTLVWENNRGMDSSLGYSVQLGDSTAAQATKIGTRGAIYSNSARRGDAIEARTTSDWHYHGQDGLSLDATAANVTLNNPLTYSLDQTGKELTVYMVGITGRTYTFGSYFISSTGSALGVVASGITTTYSTVRFMWDSTSNKFRATNAVVWSA